MTLPVYGNSLSMQQIANEFSGGTVRPLGSYYAGGSYVPAGAKGYPSGGGATSIPSSGAISLNSFFGSAAFQGFNSIATMGSSSANQIMIATAVSSSGTYVAVGYSLASGSLYAPIFSYSTNGTTWSTPAFMNGSTVGARMLAVTVNSSGLFVAVGYNQSNNAAVYATSSNGTTWTTPALMNGNTSISLMQAVTVNSSGLFVAVGVGTSSSAIYATSSNGSTWTTPAYMTGSAVTAPMYGVAVNSSGLFVAVGSGGSNQGVFSTSSNGSTWSTPASMNGYSGYSEMQAVTVNKSGVFVALGSDVNNTPGSPYPMFATSSNGTTWTSPAYISTTIPFILYSVTALPNGSFIGVGSNPGAYSYYVSSANGSTWSTPTLFTGGGTYPTMYGVTSKSSNLAVAVGTNSINNAGSYATSY